MKYDLAAYSKYRSSPHPWLGALPEHWVVRSLGSLANPRNERGRPELPLLSVVRERGVILRSSMSDEENHNFVPDDLSNYKVAHRGDLVINKMKAWQGSLGLAPADGVVSPAYFVFNLPVDDRKYAQALLRSRPYVAFFAQASDGVRIGQWDLSPAAMKRIPVCLPPADEQSAIVRFIDHVDRSIRRYIAAKRKLIATLEEQKQGIVEKAVTRGLDSGVSLKPSGVTWLGSVPDQWEVVRFKLRVGFQEGPGIMATDFRDVGTPLLRISCLEGERTSLKGCNFLDPDTVRRRWSHFAVREGDYLLSASASTGSVVLATKEVAGAIPYTGIIRLWPLSSKAFMPFVRLFMGSRPFQEQIEAAKSGVAISHFGPTHLKRMFMCLPPRDEQEAIVQYVESATAGIVDAIDRTRREIALVLEYRTRLIADVVTGKLDVREAASALRDEPSGPADEPGDLAEATAELTEEPEVVAEETEA